MKGYRFYEELENKNRKSERSKGTVVAVLLDTSRPDLVYDAVGAVFDAPDSPVASTSADTGYLWESCRRVSEARAREIHPQLFAYLEEGV